MKPESAGLLLVGAGELGSRHLQGLALVAAPEIIVIEPVAAARDRAAARYAEVSSSSAAPLRFVDHIDALDARAAVGIIATSSLRRREVIEQLVAHGVVPRQLVLEKFLFPAVADYAAVAALVDPGTVVNTPRRRWALYRSLRAHLREPFTLRVRGTSWGLCCNAVHFGDVFAFLTGAEDVRFDFALAAGVVAAKRAGYVEMHGAITGHTSASTLELQCVPGDVVALEVDVFVGGVEHRIDERTGACSGLGIAAGAPAFQSGDTGALVTSLLAGEATGLPTLAGSAAVHVPLLVGFLDHYRRFVDAEAVSCPVT